MLPIPFIAQRVSRTSLMWPLFCCLGDPKYCRSFGGRHLANPTHHLHLSLSLPCSPCRRRDHPIHAYASTSGVGSTFQSCMLAMPKNSFNEPGPYILGITAECRTLFTAPSGCSWLWILDRNFVLTSSPPDAAWSAKQRTRSLSAV